jgi:hypothetical protein
MREREQLARDCSKSCHAELDYESSREKNEELMKAISTHSRLRRPTEAYTPELST